MKKSVLLTGLLLSFLLCGAKEYTVELPAVPGHEQIFFLDLKDLQADSSTFSVMTPDGKRVPFSFDMRLERSLDKEKFKSGVNGFYSKEAAPSAERKFEIPGFLSFKRVPGVKKYIFKFKDGAKATLSRPDPAVRGWWIEVMRDPFLKNPNFLFGRKGSLTLLPEGGVAFTSPFRILRTATIADERISGRRIFALVRCKGNFGYFTVRLKNGAWNKTSAISCYFKPSLDTLQDICAEGLLASENVFPAGRYFWVCEYVKGPSVLKELHIQMPPIGRELGVSLKSDLFNQGDMVEISSFGGIGESAVPFESGPVKGLRYGIWEGKRELAYELKDLQKNSCLKGKGSQFTLKNVKEGTYILTVELFLDGTFAMKKDLRIKVQSSPF